MLNVIINTSTDRVLIRLRQVFEEDMERHVEKGRYIDKRSLLEPRYPYKMGNRVYKHGRNQSK